jgi:hypothetical protein
MKRVSSILSGLLIFLFLTSCETEEVKGSGKIVADEREVEDFKAISFSGSGTILIKQGYKDALTIQTDDNLFRYLNTEVRDGTLYIRPKEGAENKKLLPKDAIYYYVTLRDLDYIDIAGVANVKTIAQLLGDKIKIKVSGAGELHLDVFMESLEVSLSGAAKVLMKGETKKQAIKITGTGQYDALNLKSQETKISISGSGTVSVDVSNTLDVGISGAGNVQYEGSPKVTNKISGTGTVKKIE